MIDNIDKLISENHLLDPDETEDGEKKGCKERIERREERYFNRVLEIEKIYKRVKNKDDLKISYLPRFLNKSYILVFAFLFFMYNVIKKSGMSKRIIEQVDNK